MNPVIFSKLTQLHNLLQNQVREHFHHPRKVPCDVLNHPIANHQSAVLCPLECPDLCSSPSFTLSSLQPPANHCSALNCGFLLMRQPFHPLCSLFQFLQCAQCLKYYRSWGQVSSEHSTRMFVTVLANNVKHSLCAKHWAEHLHCII